MKTPQKISEEILYENAHKKILLRTSINDNGTTKEVPIYGNAKSPFGTMALVLDDEKNLYYAKEYRDGTESFVYNFSVGKHEEELSFEENTLKELEEELGITNATLDYIGDTIVGNYDTGVIKYFIATNCIFGEQQLEDGEYIEIKKSSIEEFEQHIISGKINCPLTISCYTKAKLQNKL